MGSDDAGEGGPPGEVAQIMSIQEDRARTYDQFEQGFRAHLVGGSDEDYEAVCKESTTQFATASVKIVEIEKKLQALGGASAGGLCGWIRKLQEAEKAKLYLTVGLHVERKRAAQLGAGSDTLKPSAPRDAEPESVGEGVDVAADVNALRGDSRELADLQADKVRWMQSEMGTIIESINEALDEIRYWELD
ncbi:DNA repair REX1-B-domain-containing protein [Baffinella frigidus]|nr:DNA repair REX1-B-domain-containing protein [Cryptophyta sp. CCMP2293]